MHRTKFDVGRQDPAFRGNMIYESEEDETGAKFWEENTQYTKTVLHVGPDGREIKLIKPIRSVRDILERASARLRDPRRSAARWGDADPQSGCGVTGAPRERLAALA